MANELAVVIPFYQKAPGLLRKAVFSALNQRGSTPIRVIIVDDESPIPASDELANLPPEHISKITVVKQKNAGCYPASNTALDHVSDDTDYVAFLDSDDEWTESHLEHAVWALGQGYDFYFSDFYQLNQRVTAFNRGKDIDVNLHRRIHPAYPIHEFCGDMVDQIIRGNILGTSTIVYNYRKFRTLRYREEFRHTGAEYIFWLHLAMQSQRIAFSSSPECRYGGGINIFAESGWGSDKFLSVRHDEMKWKKQILKDLSFSRAQISVVKRRIYEARLNFARGLIHNLLHNGKARRDLLIRQWKLDPLTFPAVLAVAGMVAFEKLRGVLRSN